MPVRDCLPAVLAFRPPERPVITALVRCGRTSTLIGAERPSGFVVAERSGSKYCFRMTTVEQISGAVKRLPKRDLARFRKWFAEYDAAVWDRQLAEDIGAGRLDALAQQALKEHRAGRTTEL